MCSSDLDGLTPFTQAIVDNACGGIITKKSELEITEIYETLALNSQHRSSTVRKGGKYEVNQTTGMEIQMSNLTKQVQAMMAQNSDRNQQQGGVNSVQDGDGMPYETEEVQAFNYQRERNNPYSNTYNPGWRNHHNFSYSDPNTALNGHQLVQPNTQGANQGNYNRGNYQGQGSNSQPQQWNNATNRDSTTFQPKKRSLEDIVSDLAVSTESFSHDTERRLGAMESSIKNLETQTGSSIKNLERQIGQVVDSIHKMNQDGFLVNQSKPVL